MKVAELPAEVARRGNQFVTVPLGEAELLEKGEFLKLNGDEEATVHLDARGLDLFGHYLGVPGSGYLSVITGKLREDTLKFFIRKNEEAPATFEISGKNLHGVYGGDKDLVPRERVAEVVAKACKTRDEVRQLQIGEGAMIIDVLTADLKNAPEREVKDVTRGGIRVYSHVSPRGTNRYPRVMSYWERLACENGAVLEEERGAAYLRGRSVDEIIEEMEKAIKVLLDDVVPERLEQWVAMAHQTVKDPVGLTIQIARENGINHKLTNLAASRTAELDEDHQTLYDVVNTITALQNEGVRDSQHEKLVELGGAVTAQQEAHRCSKCHRPLEDKRKKAA